MTFMLAAASMKVMDALFRFLAQNDAECCKREDAHGVEIGPCAFFEHFARSDKICPEANFFVDPMLGVVGPNQGLVTSRICSPGHA